MKDNTPWFLKPEVKAQVARLWKLYHKQMASRTQWEHADNTYNKICELTK